MTDPASRLPTLDDVAALAGVSRSTVSNVVRGSNVVAAPTRRRVVAAIEQLGYRPNAIARQLQRGRASLIGIVAHDLRNPFLAEIATLVEREIARFGLGATFCTTDGDPAGEDRAISLMLENRVSGLVFLSYLESQGVDARIGGSVPTVFIAATEPWSDSVAVDERRGGELAARHLLDLGHRRLAFVSPSRLDRADDLRLAGFEREVSVDGGEVLVVRWDGAGTPASVDGAPTEWRGLLLDEPRVSAIFASSDFLAIDVLDLADTLGVRVPDQLSLVGFDDVSFASLRRIDLTTVHQPRHELVRLGVEAIVGRIEGRIVGLPTVTLAGVTLRVRGTTGPAAGTTTGRSSAPPD